MLLLLLEERKGKWGLGMKICLICKLPIRYSQAIVDLCYPKGKFLCHSNCEVKRYLEALEGEGVKK